jgi:S-disulfanyl-L-cysteine oxidoreductase SoxD
MCSWREAWLALTLLAASATAAHAQSAAYPGVGRAATAKEVAAWDIDVRPDFKGLPAGAGSVAKGQQVWEGQCASCHGVFGESNEVFSPIVGGTTPRDIQSGRAARLTDAAYPGRTTLMKLATVSSLWDYINRAMPWAQPKSLSVEEVYAVTAYILHLGGVLPEDFVLSDRNIAAVQARLPNRKGMSTVHALWPGAGMGGARPDVRAVACMKNCAPAPVLASYLPEHARDAHGNLSEQNRAVGAQRGADTRRAKDGSALAPALALAQKHACVACHANDSAGIGPSFRAVARRYAQRADAAAYLTGKIRAGGSGVWGAMPMPPQALSEADAQLLAAWLAAGANP